MAVSQGTNPPDARNDAFTVAEDSTANVLDVLANDSGAGHGGDADGDGGDPACHGRHGDADQQGVVTFTPTPNFNGTATFTYTVYDGNGGTATATVTVTVTPVNDPPGCGQ